MIPTTLRLAWRNLWRNGRRTGLAVTAIGLSVALVLAYDGILRGYGDWMVEVVTGPMLGHVQVHAPRWRKDRAMDETLRGVSGTLAAIRGAPGVTDASARVWAPALAARGALEFALVGKNLTNEAANLGDSRSIAAEVPGRPRLFVNQPRTIGVEARTHF